MKLGWYSNLSRTERNTYWACFGGLALDSMDTTIYALVMPTLITLVGITKPEAGVLSSASLIGSAIGGWLAGILGDRVGRVRMLQITILFVAVFTLASAFTNSFWQLFFTRAFQGVGYGGEAAIGGVLISEVIAPKLRGRVAASVQGGYAIGYAISVALLPLIYAYAPPHLAWRIFFAVGILPAALVFFIRRLVPESDVFLEAAQADGKKKDRVSMWEIFGSEHVRVTIIGTLLSTGILGGAYVMITWLPTYLQMALGLPVTKTSGYLAVNILGSLVGPFIYGALSDRISRRYAFVLFLCCQATNVAVYMFAPINAATTIALGFFLGALQGGLASGMSPSFSELYPTRIRGNGAGFCISFGRGLGSAVPVMVGHLSTTMPLGKAMGICALSSYAVALVAATLLPEATGVDLHDSALAPSTAALPAAGPAHNG